MPLSECDMRYGPSLFVQDLKQSSTMAKLCDYDWMPFVCCGAHEEHKIWMTDMGQCLDLPLELEAQFSIDNQTLNFELLDGHIREFVLCLIYNCCGSFADFLQIGELLEVDLLEFSATESIIQKLASQIPLLIVDVWLKSSVFA